MAWTAPMTWTTGRVITASQLNTQLRDNMLETMPASAPGAGWWPAVDHRNKLVWRNPKISTAGTNAHAIHSEDYSSPGESVGGVGGANPGPTVVVKTAGALFIAWGCQFTPATSTTVCYAAPQITSARPDDESDESEAEESVTVNEIEAQDRHALITNPSGMSNETFAGSHHLMVHGLTEDSGEAEVRIQLLYRRTGSDSNVRWRRLFVWPMS